MQQLIIKNDVEQGKIDALLNFLKSCDIDAELKTINPPAAKKKTVFSLSTGIWKDYDISADVLRKAAWNKNR